MSGGGGRVSLSVTWEHSHATECTKRKMGGGGGGGGRYSVDDID